MWPKIFHADNIALQSFLECLGCCPALNFGAEATAKSVTQIFVEQLHQYRIFFARIREQLGAH